MKKGLQSSCAVAISANCRLDARSIIMDSTGMTADEMTAEMFEIGCLCVERYVILHFMRICILENESNGYWAWWVNIWLKDDINIGSTNKLITREYYTQHKRNLIDTTQTYDEFMRYIQRV